MRLFCHSCGGKLSKMTVFCPHCGRKQFWDCPDCGETLDKKGYCRHCAQYIQDRDRHCPKCGESQAINGGSGNDFTHCWKPDCGFKFGKGKNYCEICGTALKGGKCPACNGDFSDKPPLCPYCKKHVELKVQFRDIEPFMMLYCRNCGTLLSIQEQKEGYNYLSTHLTSEK